MANQGPMLEKMAADITHSLSEKATDFLQESNSKAAYDKALTLGEQIANYTCKELKEQIPPMITSTTNEIIKQLTLKIDSEQFTTDFINVLQTKLLDDKSGYSEEFLKKFDELFNRIIDKAEIRRENKEDANEKDNETIKLLNAENVKLKDEIAKLKDETKNPMRGNGRRKHSKSKKPKKKPTKQTKRVRFFKKK